MSNLTSWNDVTTEKRSHFSIVLHQHFGNRAQQKPQQIWKRLVEDRNSWLALKHNSRWLRQHTALVFVHLKQRDIHLSSTQNQIQRIRKNTSQYFSNMIRRNVVQITRTTKELHFYRAVIELQIRVKRSLVLFLLLARAVEIQSILLSWIIIINNNNVNNNNDNHTIAAERLYLNPHDETEIRVNKIRAAEPICVSLPSFTVPTCEIRLRFNPHVSSH